ncbi:MAG: sensor domain-containing diguanylate cyclase [Anaerolineales bacterium]|nr:sensor domain-containing diguanylate cyclase [Anaerolineales bacterium]
MSFKRWVSAPVLIGGSITTSVILTWGILYIGVSDDFIYFFSIPFIFLASIFNDRRVYLVVWAIFFFLFLNLNWFFLRVLSLSNLTALQWLTLGIASEIIYQVSSQRRQLTILNHRRTRELEAMDMTLAEITNEMDLNTFLHSIVERAAKLLNASMGEIWLYDKQKGDMEIAAYHPPNNSQVGVIVKMGEGAMGQAALTRRPIIVNNYPSWDNAMPDSVASGLEAGVVVPLLKGVELIGVLGVGRQHRGYPFTEEDQHLLSVFARQAIIAINNAQLYKDIQALAYTDVLTGINNRRRFFELAEKEYKRAQRYQRPLSIAVMDIDHFKSVNDHYGHAVGDTVLSWFAHECYDHIRKEIDIIGRVGGEEFTILFPETTVEDASEIVNRLLTQVGGTKISTGACSIQITFSAGLVGINHESNFVLDQLLDRADHALYLAKQTRNCIACWDYQSEEARLTPL